MQRMDTRAFWVLAGAGATVAVIAVGIQYGALCQPIHYP
jgi:hypothetical protein